MKVEEEAQTSRGALPVLSGVAVPVYIVYCQFGHDPLYIPYILACYQTAQTCSGQTNKTTTTTKPHSTAGLSILQYCWPKSTTKSSSESTTTKPCRRIVSESTSFIADPAASGSDQPEAQLADAPGDAPAAAAADDDGAAIESSSNAVAGGAAKHQLPVLVWSASPSCGTCPWCRWRGPS